MDIVKKIRPLKATYESLSLKYKIGISVILISMFSLVVPHDSYAVTEEMHPELLAYTIFEAGNHGQFIAEIEEQAEADHRHQTAVEKLQRQLKLTEALKKYLQQKRSPLADYASVILAQSNWKKILALSNAESSMCRVYPVQTANCWGVGGSDMWDMGSNLGEGVVAMNNFLNNAPAKSKIKYSQMTFEQMNGLYKQPARDHWVYNNMVIYNELTAIENSIK